MDHIKRLRTLQKNIPSDAAFVCASEPDLFYLSGFSGTYARILCLKNKAYFITDRRYDGIAQSLGLEKAAEVIVSSDPGADIKKILSNTRTLLMSSDTPLPVYLGFSGKTKKISTFVKDMRLIKDKDEIEIIKQAAEINGRGIMHCASILKEGMTEHDLSLEFESFVKRNKAQGTSFSTICAFSENAAIPHAGPSGRRLKKGDIVLLDCGVRYKGYCSDLTRVIAFGIIDIRFSQDYEIVRKAKKEAVKLYTNGSIIRKADEKARLCLQKHGLEALFTHSLGHGMGIDIHEAPSINKKESSKFKPGMVVSCEPGIYIKGKYGIRIEDDYLITANGSAKKLSILDDNLIIKD